MRFDINKMFGSITDIDTHSNLGMKTDIPLERDHEHVTILRWHFVPVCRERKSPHSTAVLTDDNGEELYRVGKNLMPRSEMIALAESYRDQRRRFIRR